LDRYDHDQRTCCPIRPLSSLDWERNDRLGRYNFFNFVRDLYQHWRKVLCAIRPSTYTYSDTNTNAYTDTHSHSITDAYADANALYREMLTHTAA